MADEKQKSISDFRRDAGDTPSTFRIVAPSFLNTEATKNGSPDEMLRWLYGLRRRWFSVALVFVLGVLVGFLQLSEEPDLYVGETRLLLQNKAPQVLNGVQDVTSSGAAPYNFDRLTFLSTETEILRSRRVAEQAATLLGLIGESTSEGERAQATDQVLGAYRMEQRADSNVVSIVTTSTEERLAITVPNAVADAYVWFKDADRLSSARSASAWLDAQYVELKSKLFAAENDLLVFKKEKGILSSSFESQKDTITQRLQQFNHRLAAVQGQAMAHKIDRGAIESVRKNRDLAGTLQEIRNTPLLNSLMVRLSELKVLRLEMAEKYQDAHPKVRSIDSQIEKVELELSSQIDAVLTGLEIPLHRLEEEERGLQAALDVDRKKEAQLNAIALEYDRMKREVETYQQLLDLVTARLKETNMQGQLAPSNIQVLDRAAAAIRISPLTPKRLFSIVLLALFAGIALALFREFLDDTVRTRDDVEKFLGLAFLGALPNLKKEKDLREKALTIGNNDDHLDELFVGAFPSSSAAESVRALRTGLYFMAPNEQVRCLSVTSMGAEEGKTTIAANLAFAIAQSGRRVLLVDADMRRPRLHRVFQVPSENGLSRVLVGEAYDTQRIQNVIENLDVLPCGPIPPNPAELLMAGRFREFIQKASRDYDLVLLDSPPVMAATDAVIIAGFAQGTLVVVRSGTTPRRGVLHAIQSLKAAHAKPLGIILNGVDQSSHEYRYQTYSYRYKNRPTSS